MLELFAFACLVLVLAYFGWVIYFVWKLWRINR